MTRALSYLALIGSFVAAGWSAFAVLSAMQAPASSLARVVASISAPPLAEGARVSLPFLAIYGTPDEPVKPAPLQVKETMQPSKPFGFVLKGLIAVGDVRWAVLSHNGADMVVREGEVLAAGIEVTAVRAESIELATEDGPMLLGFNADAPVALAQMPRPVISGSTGPKGNFRPAPTTAVLFQDMSAEEIIAALEQAEELRTARGWITQSD